MSGVETTNRFASLDPAESKPAGSKPQAAATRAPAKSAKPGDAMKPHKDSDRREKHVPGKEGVIPAAREPQPRTSHRGQDRKPRNFPSHKDSDKKLTSGIGNWGKPGDDAPPAATEQARSRAPEGEKAAAAKPDEAQQEAVPEEPKEMTLEEYRKTKAQASKFTLPPKRQVEETAAPQALEMRRRDDETVQQPGRRAQQVHLLKVSPIFENARPAGDRRPREERAAANGRRSSEGRSSHSDSHTGRQRPPSAADFPAL